MDRSLRKVKEANARIVELEEERPLVLIIDDDKDFTEMVKLNLEATGRYEVMTENKAARAFSAVRDTRPDLILLDVMMPFIDGGEIAHQIDTDEALKDIPVVFLTGTITKDEISSQGRLIGKHIFLAKPVTGRELVECIERTLANKDNIKP